MPEEVRALLAWVWRSLGRALGLGGSEKPEPARRPEVRMYVWRPEDEPLEEYVAAQVPGCYFGERE